MRKERELMSYLPKMAGVPLMTLALVAAACGGDAETATGPTATGPIATGSRATGPTATGPTATGSTATGPTATGGDACEPSSKRIEVSAVGLSFDQSCLAAPAGKSFTIEFTNNASIPHNVAIYTDQSAAKSLFVGESFLGVETMTYDVPAIDAGTYFFRCDVHPPQMNGTFVVS
jgi:plastocyanin